MKPYTKERICGFTAIGLATGAVWVTIIGLSLPPVALLPAAMMLLAGVLVAIAEYYAYQSEELSNTRTNSELR